MGNTVDSLRLQRRCPNIGGAARLPLCIEIGNPGPSVGKALKKAIGDREWYLEWETHLIVELTDHQAAMTFVPQLLCDILNISLSDHSARVVPFWFCLGTARDCSIGLHHLAAVRRTRGGRHCAPRLSSSRVPSA